MCLSSHSNARPEAAATACHAVAATTTGTTAVAPLSINDSRDAVDRPMFSVDDFMDCDSTWESIAAPHHCSTMCDNRAYPTTDRNSSSTKEPFLASAGVDGKVEAMDQLHVRVDRLKISVDDFIEDDTTTTCSMTSADAQWAEQPVEVNLVRPVSSQELKIVQPTSVDQCRSVQVAALDEPIASQHTTASKDGGREQKVSVDDFIDCETTAGELLWEYACIGWEESYWTVNVRCRIDLKEPDARDQKEASEEMGDEIPRVIFIRTRASLDGYKNVDPLGCAVVDHTTTLVVGEHVISMVQTNDYFIDEDHPEYYDQTLIAV